MEVLKEQGVDLVFGYPGGQVIPLYDALYEQKGRIRHILTAHEQGASHAADGYARSTGKVGVCIATSGPGATNLVTGLATAYMDSSPVVAITGNVPISLLGKDSFQEVDITGVTMPITKHNYIIKDKDDLVATLREAFHIARSGRPGPVLVDVPKNIQTDDVEYEYSQPLPVERDVRRLRQADLEKAVKMIREAERPMCYIGGGVIRSDLNARMIEAGTHLKTAVPERELDWTQTPSFIPSNAVIVTGGDITYDDHGNIVSDTRTFAPSSTPVYFKSWIGYLGKLNGPYTMGYNLFEGDFVKLRNVSISYDFSSMIKQSKVIKGLELSIIGNNLWMWKKLDNEDPDAAYKNFSYPTERMVGFNLSLTL